MSAMRRLLFPLVTLAVAVALGAGIARAGWQRGHDDGFAEGVAAATEAIEVSDGEATLVQVGPDRDRARGGGGFVLVPLLLGVLVITAIRRRRPWQGRDPRERLDHWHERAHAGSTVTGPPGDRPDGDPDTGPSWPGTRSGPPGDE